MVFILYKLYVLLPYTYPTPKLSPHRRLCASLDFQKKTFSMFFKPFELRGHRQCPHKTPSNCNTSVIPMSVMGLTRRETCGSIRKALFEDMVNTGRVRQ